MKNQNLCFLLLILALGIVGCGQRSRKVPTFPENADTILAVTAPDQHNASNSLDWAGVYLGTLPCADCVGVETELTINQDNTYGLKTRYLGKADQPFEEKGTFSWNEAGNTITLSGAKNRPSQYFVAENKVIQLDMTGNKITGSLSENYILKKH